MQYTFTCQQGHEPVTFTAEAENEDEAVDKIMEQASAHLAEVHTDMAGGSEEDLRNMVRGGLQSEG